MVDGAERTELVERLFGQHYRPLVRTAALWCASPVVAEELVMEAFVGLHRRLGGPGPIDNPAAYLRTSVMNLCRSAHRRRVLERRVAHRLPIDASSGADDGDRLWDVLADLSADQRACVVLRFYEDRSLDQISHDLAMPVSNQR